MTVPKSAPDRFATTASRRDVSDRGVVPRYRAIHDTIRERIVSGKWAPGFKLPSEPELARTFGCARMTISKALGTLADRGLVTRRRRAGTIVTAPRFEETVLEIHNIEAEILTSGHAYRFERLGRAIRRATSIDATALGVAPGTPVLAVSGLHRADGRPHALEERLIHLAAVPDARRERFVTTSPGRWLLNRIPWTEAEHRISALNSSADTAQQLGIARSTACLCIERRTRHDGVTVTYVRVLYPCDRHQLVAKFRSGRS